MNLLENQARQKMKSLISKLNTAADAYYNGREIMSDYEYDQLLAELQSLEQQFNVVLENSPTRHVGSPVKVDKLQKVNHEFPALSLDKTKDIDKVVSTFNVTGNVDETVVSMWKLDGSTVQLTYEGGKLKTAATRGNGYIGQDITHNAPYITGIPLSVNTKDKFTVRGEAVISFANFELINSELTDDEKFKNPRNLAAASITMLDPNDMKDRHVNFLAFKLVDHPELSSMKFADRLKFCAAEGFDTVPFKELSVNPDGEFESLQKHLEDSTNVEYSLPVDGLVIAYNDTSYTDNLQGTEHHPNVLKGFAFKWQDEVAKTVLREIEWSPSRTGLLNPIAIFDPVELEGTTVTRASLHNFSIMRNLHIHVGDEIEVQKANKIIPQVVRNISDSPEYLPDNLYLWPVPESCPTCGEPVVINVSVDGIETIRCNNVRCDAKLVYSLEHFCERTCMNIEGLSEATLQTFVDNGYIHSFGDIFRLDQYANKIQTLPGFGEKSWENIWAAIQAARNTNMVRFLSAISIPNVGNGQAKAISKYFKGDVNKFFDSTYLDFSVIDGIGRVISDNILCWLHNEQAQQDVKDVLQYLTFDTSEYEKETGTSLQDKTCVVTGKVYHYKNRKELEADVEANGGKVASSVTSKTSYLINNDLESTSSKNKKAHELGIPIISEEDFLNMIGKSY